MSEAKAIKMKVCADRDAEVASQIMSLRLLDEDQGDLRRQCGL